MALDAAEHEPTMFTASSDARRRATCILAIKNFGDQTAKDFICNI